MKNLKPYLPSLGMVAVVVLQALYAAYTDGALTTVELLNVVIALLGAVALYIVPNVQGAGWLKPLTAALTAALLVVVNGLTDVGMTPQLWIMAVIQFFGGLGIVIGTNRYAPKHAPLDQAA